VEEVMAVTRNEHLAECKKRALKVLETGKLKDAVASMASGLREHPETIDMACEFVTFDGMLAASKGNEESVRRWIMAFK